MELALLRRRRVQLGLVGAAVALALVVVLVVVGDDPDKAAAEQPVGRDDVSSLEPVKVPKNLRRNRVSIPSQGVVAPIVTVSVDDGVLDIPRDLSRVGLYDEGGQPDGAEGSMLVVGHLNYNGEPGVLGKIGQLAVGDVVISRGKGKPQAWRVTSAYSYLKKPGLPADIFSATGERRLVLVTCGGNYDAALRQYDTNIVVTATPVPTERAT